MRFEVGDQVRLIKDYSPEGSLKSSNVAYCKRLGLDINKIYTVIEVGKYKKHTNWIALDCGIWANAMARFEKVEAEERK